MNKLNVLILATVAICIAAWVASYRAKQQFGLEETAKLLPDLSEQLAQIDRVQIVAAGNDSTTLINQDGQWLLEQRDNYPADMQQVRTALRDLAEARKLEAKTALASNYAQLGVQDVDLARETTVHLMAEAGDTSVVNLLIGKSGRGGSYVRQAGSEQSWLIDKRIALGRNTADYLDKALIVLPRDEVQRVAVTPLAGDAYAIEKGDDDDESFSLQPAAPSGRKLNMANINRLAAALASLRISDVMDSTEEELSWSEAVLQSFDGLQLTLKLAKGEDSSQRYLQLSASALADEDGDIDDEVQERAAALNARSQGRIYRAPQYTVDALAMSYDMLLQPPAESEKD